MALTLAESAKLSTDMVLAGVIETVIKAKPAAAKGRYLRNLALASTMGPGVRLDTIEGSFTHHEAPRGRDAFQERKRLSLTEGEDLITETTEKKQNLGPVLRRWAAPTGRLCEGLL